MPQHIEVPGMGVVEFPDGMGDDQIASAIKRNMAPQTAATQQAGGADASVDPVIDTVKSTGIGAVKSTLGLADLPQVALRLGNRAGEYVSDKLTGSGPNNGPTTFANRYKDFNKPYSMTAPMPSKIWQKAIEEKTGPFYEPKTYPGEWGETIGGFLPNALGGAGNVVTRLATQAVLPALASEGAGYLTQGTKAELPARMIAAALTGPAAARATAGRVAPTADALKQAYRDVVRDPAFLDRPLQWPRDPEHVANMVRNDLQTGGHDALNAPVPFRRADQIADIANRQPTGPGLGPVPSNTGNGLVGPTTTNQPTIADLQAVRMRLSADERAARSNQISGAPEEASRTAKRAVDRFMGQIEPQYADANRNYATAKASEYLQGKRDIALDRSGAANSGQNIGNTQRQRLVDILASPRASGNFTQAQLDEMRGIARGTTASNTARAWANRLGGGGGIGQTLIASGLLGGGGYYAGGNEGAAGGLAVALAGRGLKGVENAIVNRQINRLDRNIRGTAPLHTAPHPMENEAIARALLRSNAAAQSHLD